MQKRSLVVLCCFVYVALGDGGGPDAQGEDHHTEAGANPKDFLTMLHNKNKIAPLSRYKPTMLSAYRDFKRSADEGVLSYKRANAQFPFRGPRNNGLAFKRAAPGWWPFELVDKKSEGGDMEDDTEDVIDDEVDDEIDDTYNSGSFRKKADLHRGRQGEINLKNLGASLYPGSWAGKTSFGKFRTFKNGPDFNEEAVF